MPSPAHQIARMLAPAAGERVAAADLLPLVYDELRDLARARVDQLARGYTLRATDLVHEAWLRVVKGGDPGWDGRAHFFGAAANAMRNILVEQARRRFAQKRDAGRKEPLADDLPEMAGCVPHDDLLTLHDALTALAAAHERPARVVELRFFSGLEMAEIARVLDVSLPTIERDWRFARAWLQERMGGSALPDG